MTAPLPILRSARTPKRRAIEGMVSSDIDLPGDSPDERDAEDEFADFINASGDDPYREFEKGLPKFLLRPAWQPTTFTGLLQQAWAKKGNLTEKHGKEVWKVLDCQLCSDPLYVDRRTERERGPKVDGYKRDGRPPIDHYAVTLSAPATADPMSAHVCTGDWIDRLNVIIQLGMRNTACTQSYIRKVIAMQYEAPGLRVVHKECNLKRPKSYLKWMPGQLLKWAEGLPA